MSEAFLQGRDFNSGSGDGWLVSGYTISSKPAGNGYGTSSVSFDVDKEPEEYFYTLAPLGDRSKTVYSTHSSRELVHSIIKTKSQSYASYLISGYASYSSTYVDLSFRDYVDTGSVVSTSYSDNKFTITVSPNTRYIFFNYINGYYIRALLFYR